MKLFFSCPGRWRWYHSKSLHEGKVSYLEDQHQKMSLEVDSDIRGCKLGERNRPKKWRVGEEEKEGSRGGGVTAKGKRRRKGVGRIRKAIVLPINHICL